MFCISHVWLNKQTLKMKNSQDENFHCYHRTDIVEYNLNLKAFGLLKAKLQNYLPSSSLHWVSFNFLTRKITVIKQQKE